MIHGPKEMRREAPGTNCSTTELKFKEDALLTEHRFLNVQTRNQ